MTLQRLGSLPTATGRLSESQVRDADAEYLGEPAAVEGARRRIASLPRLYRAHGSSHLVGQRNLRPRARIRCVRLPLRAKLENFGRVGPRLRLAVLHHTARYCQYGWPPTWRRPPRCRVVSPSRQTEMAPLSPPSRALRRIARRSAFPLPGRVIAYPPGTLVG
jgi:hypothetical protein